MARKQPPPRGPQLELAGALGVAFVNTAGAREENRQVGVRSYAELLVWSQQVGVVSAAEAERLRQLAAERPDEAAAVYERAVKVRSVLFRLFLATGTKRQLPPEDLATANEALARALPALRMVPAEQGLQWGWAGDEGALDRMLWPLLFSAAELLISARGRPHVRQCAFKGCLLFFVDRSPSGQRKWCDMKTCGNRAKALRHRKWRRGSQSSSFWD
ncbi:MAG: hypothetical protein GY719_06510 [bacterium]|nr:hypothetical protein [bacterium]